MSAAMSRCLRPRSNAAPVSVVASPCGVHHGMRLRRRFATMRGFSSNLQASIHVCLPLKLLDPDHSWMQCGKSLDGVGGKESLAGAPHGEQGQITTRFTALHKLKSSGKACIFLFSSISMAQACYNLLVLGPCERFLGCLTSIDFHSSHVEDCSAAMQLLCGGGPALVSFSGGPKWAKSCTWAI